MEERQRLGAQSQSHEENTWYDRFLIILCVFSLGIAGVLCVICVILKSTSPIDRSSAVSFVVVINGQESELLQHPSSIKELEAEVSRRMINFIPERYIYTYLDASGRSIEIRSNEEFVSFMSYYKNPIFETIKIYVEECCKAFTPWIHKFEVYNFDVVIIGSGAAGLTAAIAANQLNPNMTICILEKEAQLGGDSIKASSGMNACGTDTQRQNGINDTAELFYGDTIKSGQGLSNENLVKILTNSSKDAWDFLKYLGIHLTAVTQCGGHGISRTHRPQNLTVGYAIVSGLTKHISQQKHSKITNITRCSAKELIYDHNLHKVTGVVVSHEGKNLKIFAGAIILATGGFGHDDTEDSLLKEFVPHLKHLPTTTGRQAVGEGVKMARRIGVELVHMNQVQVHPTGFVDPNNPNARTKFLAPELLRGAGGIMINETGNRFCNELGYRDYVSSQIIKCCRPRGEYPQAISVILLNHKGVELFGPTLKFYLDKGLIRKFNNLEEVSDAFGVSLNGMKKTLKEYKESAKKGRDEFNKTVFPVILEENDTFYAGLITPVVHYTMGGVRIDEKANVIGKQVFKKTNEEKLAPIKGLYAAGEVTGGVHGKNRLVGNSILECIVFGRIAGESAIKYAQKFKYDPVIG